MTTHEITEHLEHLLKYVRYSEDAPALREAIEMLRCSEMPNSSDERTDKRTGTHACDCISRQQAIDALKSAKGKDPFGRYDLQNIGLDWGVEAIENLPSAQPEVRTQMFSADCISRQAVIKEFNCCELTPDGGIDVNYAIDFINQLPSAQPDIVHCPDCKYGVHSGCGDRYICTVNYELRMEHDSSFYCGYGKRREDGQNT